MSMKVFTYVVIAAVAAAIIAGFFIVGSPKEERLRRFDEKRVQDLQNIQGAIVNYWQSKASLPANLDYLTDSISGFRAPVDPETGLPYTYEVKGNLSFVICADFSRPTLGETSSRPLVPKQVYRPDPYYYGPESWVHGAGRTCFDRTIDPEIYKVRTPAD